MEGLKALSFFLSCRPTCPPPHDTVIGLAELVLTLNNFSFNSSNFLQTKGVVMGTCMGPSCDCLFVRLLEQSLFRNYTNTIPHLFLQYIYDYISAALCSLEELKQFINFANTYFTPNPQDLILCINLCNPFILLKSYSFDCLSGPGSLRHIVES
eukprot:g39440.t1